MNIPYQFSSVQSLSRVRLFATPWIAARQASLSITNSWSSLRLTSIESVTPSSHLILWCPFFLLPPIPPSIRVFSNESTLRIRWPKYWSFSFSISPSNHQLPQRKCWLLQWEDVSYRPHQKERYLAFKDGKYATTLLPKQEKGRLPSCPLTNPDSGKCCS